MIRYALHCAAGHEFESWFRDSAAYDAQVRRGLVACPECGTTRIAKRIMAPAVATREERAAAPVAMMGERERQIRAMIAALHRHVRENAEHVGEAFAEEARRIHAGEAEERAIHGVATLREAMELREEGIAVLPLPPLPDDAN
ncbi:DUF1178 family protein [Rhabdaerophilum calidifontis]|uniref:DUF1178 family protein n=1 Tax=Rhabdaerophilum calidifontis TaxID=2604328 RepID=UPI00123B1C71|nr:DUF1178 family protein [Rhabdaerophilum calidifontis]